MFRFNCVYCFDPPGQRLCAPLLFPRIKNNRNNIIGISQNDPIKISNWLSTESSSESSLVVKHREKTCVNKHTAREREKIRKQFLINSINSREILSPKMQIYFYPPFPSHSISFLAVSAAAADQHTQERRD